MFTSILLTPKSPLLIQILAVVTTPLARLYRALGSRGRRLHVGRPTLSRWPAVATHWGVLAPCTSSMPRATPTALSAASVLKDEASAHDSSFDLFLSWLVLVRLP
jgi:hypothetical protein